MMNSVSRGVVTVGWCLWKFPVRRNMGEALSWLQHRPGSREPNMEPLLGKRTHPAGFLRMEDYLLYLENHFTHTALAASKSPTGLGYLFILHFNHSLRKSTLQSLKGTSF